MTRYISNLKPIQNRIMTIKNATEQDETIDRLTHLSQLVTIP